MNPIVYALTSILLVTGSQLLLKQGTLQMAARPSRPAGLIHRIRSLLWQRHILLGLVFNGLAAVFWLLALSRLELSYVFPLLSLNYILIPLLATVFFQEKLSAYRLVGIGVICAGISLIAIS